MSDERTNELLEAILEELRRANAPAEREPARAPTAESVTIERAAGARAR